MEKADLSVAEMIDTHSERQAEVLVFGHPDFPAGLVDDYQVEICFFQSSRSASRDDTLWDCKERSTDDLRVIFSHISDLRRRRNRTARRGVSPGETVSRNLKVRSRSE